MRLTKLEINGFKSFARKTELFFEPGITSIVGPNGSGKSNIADAVRWVLGEQSARILRGTKMEDIIFNGSESRKPQSYCEVSLTFDNTDSSLPLDFSEITISRRVFRSGESEYSINRNSCRLKDINDLFRDTGVGKEGYSIIGQGRVDEILSNKSEDRRVVFEEAAGVMLYRVRKEDAERRLAHTRDNLTRIDDILGELELQLEPLAKQSEKAKEYLELRDELKNLELNVFIQQYERIRNRMDNIRETTEQIEAELLEQAVFEKEAAQKLNVEQIHANELESTITELQRSLLDLSSGAEALTGEAKVIAERVQNLQREKARLLTEEEQDQGKLTAILSGLEFDSAEAEKKKTALNELSAEITEVESEIARIDQKITESETNLEKDKNRMMEALNRLSDVKSQQSRLHTMRSAFEERLQNSAEEKHRLEQEAEALSSEYAEATCGFNALNNDKTVVVDLKAKLQSELNENKQTIDNTSNAAAQAERELHSRRSRLNVLSEMKKDYEGFYSSVRRLLKDCENNSVLKKSTLGVVAELIKVPSELETAVEMALGPAVQNLVTPTEDDAKHIIEHLRKNNYGRATCLPLSAVHGRTLTEDELAIIQRKGCLGIASKLIAFNEKYRGILENLLGRTVIVDDLDTGIAMMRIKNTFRIATLKGDIINPGGSMTGGSLQKKEFSLLGREREMAELSELIVQNESEHQKLLDELEILKRIAQDKEKDISEAEQKIHVIDIELTRQNEKLEIIQKYMESNRSRRETLENESSQLTDSMSDIDEQLKNMDDLRKSLEQGHVVSQKDIIEAQEAIASLRIERNKENDTATAYKVQLMAIKKEQAAFEQELKRIQQERKNIENRQALRRNEIQNGEKTVAGLVQRAAGLQEKIASERQEVDARNNELNQLELSRAESLETVRSIHRKREDIAGVIKELTERKHKAELNLGKFEVELTAMQNSIWDSYNLTYEGALEYRTNDVSLSASNTRIDELKQAMRALGDVNVGAIEDYKNIKERFETLSTQRADLVKAEEDLQILITELLATMRVQFKEQFDIINRNFGEVFKELFGGGFAELKLSDADDVLNCNIDIVAQPPGKKLQLLSLLSGGERALTAIALLFAMLKLKPVPFCVLDEIESALDEVNVANFADYLKQYSDKTQFILITHRRGSMEASNVLYGVAMEEKGVSKLVSVKLTEAVG